VIINQLLTDLLIHASQWVVISSKIACEFCESTLHEVLNSNTLILGDTRRQTESLDGSSNTNSNRFDWNFCGDVAFDILDSHVRDMFETSRKAMVFTNDQRVGVENLMKGAFAKFTGDLAGNYYPLTGMDEKIRQQLVDDHFLFMSGDPNLKVAGMERDWPEGRGIFHNAAKTFLVWVNEEDQLRIISMEMGGDVRGVFERLARGIKTVGDSVKAESGKEFQLSEKFGFIHSCPTNLGTGMRASVHVDLPGWTKDSIDALKARCEVLSVQPRGTRGESGGQTGHTYDISNKHRLGHSEVELVQTMIDGVNTLYKEDLELQKKHGM
jgi:protein-arginine kinase